MFLEVFCSIQSQRDVWLVVAGGLVLPSAVLPSFCGSGLAVFSRWPSWPPDTAARRAGRMCARHICWLRHRHNTEVGAGGVTGSPGSCSRRLTASMLQIDIFHIERCLAADLRGFVERTCSTGDSVSWRPSHSGGAVILFLDFVKGFGGSFNASTVIHVLGLKASPVVVALPPCPAIVHIVGSWPSIAGGRTVVRLEDGRKGLSPGVYAHAPGVSALGVVVPSFPAGGPLAGKWPSAQDGRGGTWPDSTPKELWPGIQSPARRCSERGGQCVRDNPGLCQRAARWHWAVG